MAAVAIKQIIDMVAFWWGFFSFTAVASVNYIYFRAVMVRPGGGGWVRGQSQVRGGGKAIFFLYNLRPDYFFSNGRVRQKGGMIQAN